MGITPNDSTAIFGEKEHGDVGYNSRKLVSLIKECQSGDYVYVSELSRLGRTMTDVFNLVNEFCQKGKKEAEEVYKRTNVMPKYGAIVIQCKDKTQIESESIGGKAVLFALSLAAELELSNIRQRTQSALNAIKSNIKENGTHVSKAGNVITHLGRDKGCDLSAAQSASISSKRARAEEWRRTNIGYNAVRRWVYEGRSNEDIIAEFNHFRELQPDNFCTPKGCALTEGTLKVWRREFKLLKDMI